MASKAASDVAQARIEVWDTQYFPQSQAFSAFREGLCSAFMPWSINSEPEGGFEGRIDSILVGDGSVGHVRMTPVVAVRDRRDLAHSSADCVYGNFVLTGQLTIEQGGRVNTARRGDVILYDSARPTILREESDGHYEDVPFKIPKSQLGGVKNIEDLFSNVVLRNDNLIRPLSSSLTFLAEHMSSLTHDEASALFEACVRLLPVAVSYAERNRAEQDHMPQASPLLREILDFITRHISNADLSPKMTAENLGISIRYVHKLFAAHGTTFATYVSSKRLEQIRKDLNLLSCRNQPISALAYRWGFNDLSTFNRSFKQRYGVTPSQYRASISR